jgi:hypothetical protein
MPLPVPGPYPPGPVPSNPGICFASGYEYIFISLIRVLDRVTAETVRVFLSRDEDYNPKFFQ